MRPVSIAAAILSLSVVACDTASPVAIPDQPSSAAAAASAPDVPIRGTCEATQAEPPTFAPPILHRVSTGTCLLSHLGRASLRTVAQVNTATLVQVADITYTAASGDALFASSVGSATPAAPGMLHFTGITTFTGGTGRFAGATGQMNVTGTLNSATGAASFSYEGRIAYAGVGHAGR